MKPGKILVLILGVALIALMIFMASSDDSSAPQQEVKPQAQAKPAPQSKSVDLIDDKDVKNIKILQQSVKERDFKVSSSYLVSCAPCHGDDGRGKIAPPIGGKSKDQILTSLKDYKAGKIKNSLMSGLLTNVSDESLDKLADEISKFKE